MLTILIFKMMLSTARKSRRLAGAAAEQPPPPSIAKKGSRLRTTLSRDFFNGKPVESHPAIHWKLDGTSPPQLSFLEKCYDTADDSDDSDFEIDGNSVETVDADVSLTRELLFEEEDLPDAVNEAEDDDDSEAGTEVEDLSSFDSGAKLIPFPDLKLLIESNSVCKECAIKGVVSPLKLSEETFGVATNLKLVCHPCDRRQAQHINNMEAARLEEG